VFHVKPPARWQAFKDLILGVQGRDEELRRQAQDLIEEPLQVHSIELRRGIIHKQRCQTRAASSVVLQLPKQHRGGQQFLLPA
jgi:Mor family transcriptional regulator